MDIFYNLAISGIRKCKSIFFVASLRESQQLKSLECRSKLLQHLPIFTQGTTRGFSYRDCLKVLSNAVQRNRNFPSTKPSELQTKLGLRPSKESISKRVESVHLLVEVKKTFLLQKNIDQRKRIANSIAPGFLLSFDGTGSSEVIMGLPGTYLVRNISLLSTEVEPPANQATSRWSSSPWQLRRLRLLLLPEFISRLYRVLRLQCFLKNYQ
ncbi:unnamed protein product, partial [Larinioides sclopetarius]